jgi:hypothetical protein
MRPDGGWPANRRGLALPFGPDRGEAGRLGPADRRRSPLGSRGTGVPSPFGHFRMTVNPTNSPTSITRPCSRSASVQPVASRSLTANASGARSRIRPRIAPSSHPALARRGRLQPEWPSSKKLIIHLILREGDASIGPLLSFSTLSDRPPCPFARPLSNSTAWSEGTEGSIAHGIRIRFLFLLPDKLFQSVTGTATSRGQSPLGNSL